MMYLQRKKDLDFSLFPLEELNFFHKGIRKLVVERNQFLLPCLIDCSNILRQITCVQPCSMFFLVVPAPNRYQFKSADFNRFSYSIFFVQTSLNILLEIIGDFFPCRFCRNTTKLISREANQATLTSFFHKFLFLFSNSCLAARMDQHE